MQLFMKPKPLRAERTMLAFTTPITVRPFEATEALNRHISSFALEWRKSEPGEQRSNLGGWHSPDQLLQRLGEPWAGQLAQMFLQTVKEAVEAVAEPPANLGRFGIEAWVNINEKGDSNAPHIHPGSVWSGVYYVATDPPGQAEGRLRFTDPRTAALTSAHPLNPFHATNNIKIAPEPGTFVVFPSFLYHSVSAYNGINPRISLAFNLR